MCCRFGLVALMALLAGPALGQDKPPPPTGKAKPADPGAAAAAAPRDESKPAPKADADKMKSADETALRDALKTLARSLQDGKADGIKQVIYAANPTERKMVDAMAAMAVQIAGLYKASAKAFGEDEARALTGDAAAEMSRIDDAAVSIDGDTATVHYRAPAEPQSAPGEDDPPPAPGKNADNAPAPGPDEGTPAAEPKGMILKRVEGRWRVPMSELSKDATPAGIEQRLADLDVQTRVISDLAQEVAKGKYRSADEAAEAWHAKMMQALTPGKPPAGKAEGGKPAKGSKPTGEQEGEADAEKRNGKPAGEPRDESEPAPESDKQ